MVAKVSTSTLGRRSPSSGFFLFQMHGKITRKLHEMVNGRYGKSASFCCFVQSRHRKWTEMISGWAWPSPAKLLTRVSPWYVKLIREVNPCMYDTIRYDTVD